MNLKHCIVFGSAGLVAVSSVRAAQPEDKAAISQEAQPEQSADDALESAMKAIDDRIGKIEDLTAKFEQRKTSAMLRKPMVSSGEVVARGDVVLWRTSKPRDSEMRVGGGEIRLLYPGDKLLEIYPIQNAKGLAGGPLPRLRELREQFTLARASDQPENSTNLEIVLTPRAEELRRAVSTVRVTINTSVPCVTKIVMTDPEGEETSVEFTEIRLNMGVKESDVVLQVPEGTRESRPLGGAEKPRPTEPKAEPSRGG